MIPSADVRRFRRAALVLVLAAAIDAPALAQTLPADPIRVFDGRVVVGGEAVATAGDADDTAFFNYTDYEHNALRLMRLGVTASWRPLEWLAFVSDLRSENLQRPTAYAAYVRVHPWRGHAFDVQAGRIPPSFGAFGRQIYGTDNPVIGYPLGYQYLTSLRSDAVPATADDLLRMRGRGWEASYPIGDGAALPGLPLISAFRWDTGIQMRWQTGPVEVTGAITNGTLSNPRVDDDNGGKQVSGRIGVSPAVGLKLGASASQGAWLSRRLPSGADGDQRAFGADAEYSRDHWLVRGELVWSRWTLPHALAPLDVRDVSALAAWTEGRYRFTPRIFAGARLGMLGFSRLLLDPATRGTPWDAAVQRLEGSLGYYLQRNLVARLGVQSNWRDGGRVSDRTFFSAQLAYWF